MADRYWVGGSGTWNTSSTTNWSTASGGASGASVPTASDSVFFDQAGTYTVTCTGGLACLDFTVSAGTVTFADGTSPTFSISGSMSLVAGTVWSATGAITFKATTTGKTVTTNGTTLSGTVTFNGVGGGWTLGSALSVAGLNVTAGTFDTSSVNNWSITSTSQIVLSGSTARVVNLNASTITISTASANAFLASTITNLTFNAGTSQINFTGSPSGINCVGLTFYNVAFTSAAAANKTITGANTFNNLAITAPSIAGVANVTFDSPQTINGSLSTTGTAGNRRVFFASATYGIGQTLTVANESLTDADFRDLYVKGAGAPLTGTRLGNRGNCSGITFSTPKTVYWNLAGAQNWSANGWATTSTGSPSTDNFPLPQDTATFTNAGSVTGTITLDTAIAYISNVDMSGRTTAMTLGTSNATTVYGNWTNGSGTAFTGTSTLTFSGGGTQTITSAGKTFLCPITIDTYGGTVQLADALNIGTQTLTVTNGTFNTQGYAVTANQLSSSNSNVRTINLGSSTVTLAVSNIFSVEFSTATNLTFNAGTSQITMTGTAGSGISTGVGLTFYNVTSTQPSATVKTTNITTANTFNNLTFASPSATNIHTVTFQANQTINGTLTCAGASAIRRVFLTSDTIGTQRTLTVNAISADDCDFRDIVIAGTASGSSPTRAGNCGNNSGITFPSSKTVYWNLAGSQNWSATGWATGSGGSPAVNNFPLAQDTAVFDNTGSAGTVTMDTNWSIGTFDASLRTNAMIFSNNGTSTPGIYGDWKFGTGVTVTNTTGAFNFSKNGTQTITSNGVQFNFPVTINNPNAYVQLADALSLNSARILTLTAGTFDAVTYNVTTGLFSNSVAANTLKMGSGTWTLSGTGTVWGLSVVTAPTIIAGTSTIILSDTSTASRTFAGAGRYYNKLTIGGTTGVSTTTITGTNTFGELASTKTVAHTIDFGNNSQTFGKWSITGTAGNVVTLNQPTTVNVIAGPAVTGVDYLAMGVFALTATSPGEFYAGANSTGTGAAPVYRTAAPSPRTLYWVGGTGNWSSTTNWSTSSGGVSGAAIPTSLDSVNFDSLSNATAYTATIDVSARCAAFTMAGPASGNVTFAGTQPIAYHGNVSFTATGITRSYSGNMNFAGNSSYTFTTNGLTLASNVTVNGIGSTWTLGSALTTTGVFTVTYGAFSTSVSNYAMTLSGSTGISSGNSNVRSISLNGSAISLSNTVPVTFATTTNLTFNAGTSSLTVVTNTVTFSGGGQSFYNVSYTNSIAAPIIIAGANTYNNLTFTGPTSNAGIALVTFSANQTINGTLTLGAGTASAYRTFLASDTIGTQRTLSVNALAAGAADIDFRDIAITGTASPISGTRFGDCKGNSGITFPAAKTVYYRQTGNANWGATGTGSWSATSGGSLDATMFPLAQDTAIFPASTYPASGSTTTINASYNIGTIDMSLRTSNTMTLTNGTTIPQIYGNWINGTGITLSGSGTMTFAGRTTQTITSAGKTFTQGITVWTPSGSVTLQDAFSSNLNSAAALSLVQGTFDAATYNVTLSGAAAQVSAAGSFTRTIAVGSGTWTIAGAAWNASTATNLTVTGTGTISLTSASAKTFDGGGANYSGITVNQGGAGTLTITGNNTFKTITNSYSATGAATISFGSTYTTLTNPFTATGASAKVLSLTGTSAASPATLIFSGAGSADTTSDYLSISNVRAYPVTTSWYAGANSTNLGSLGWIFSASGGVVYAAYITESNRASDSIAAAFGAITYNSNIAESNTAADLISAAAVFKSALSESASSIDSITAKQAFKSLISETGSVVDSISSNQIFQSQNSESASANQVNSSSVIFRGSLSESASAIDSIFAQEIFGSSVSNSVSAIDTASSLQVFETNLSEQASASQTNSALQVFNSNANEQASASQTNSALQVFISNTNEQASASQINSASAMFSGYLTEAASASQTNLASAIFGGNVNDSITVNSTSSAKQTFASSVQNAAQISDQASATEVFKGSISESVTAQDLDSVAASTFNAASNETAQAFQTNSAKAQFGSNVSNTATVADSDVGYIRFPGSISESGAALDSISAAQRFRTAILESSQAANIFSAIEVFKSSISQTATASQTNSAKATFGSAVSNTATSSETNSAKVRFGSAVNESASISDSNVGYIRFPGLVSETAQVSGQDSAVARFAPRISETGTASSSVSSLASVGSNVNATAQASATNAAKQSFGSAVSETASSSAAFAAKAIFRGIINEAAQGSDQFSSKAVFLAAFSEFVQAFAQNTAYAIYPSSVSESSTSSETNAASQVLRGYVSEAASGSQTNYAKVFFASLINELATSADSVNAPGSIYNATTSNTVSVLGTPTTSAVFYAAVIAYAGITDLAAARYLWELIDDSQTPNWSNINDTQTAGWVEINDNQTPNWQNITTIP